MRQIPTILAFTIDTTIERPHRRSRPCADASQAVRRGDRLFDDRYAGRTSSSDKSAGNHTSGARNQSRISTLFSLAAAAVQTYTGKPLEMRRCRSSTKAADHVVLLLPPRRAARTRPEHGSRVVQRRPSPDAASFRSPMRIDEPPQRSAPVRAAARSSSSVRRRARQLGDFVHDGARTLPGLFVNARLADQMMRGILSCASRRCGSTSLLIFALPLLLGARHSRSCARRSRSQRRSSATLVYAYINLSLFVKELVLGRFGPRRARDAARHDVRRRFTALSYEGGQKRMVTNLFGMHVSPAIVSDILGQDDPRGALALKGKRVKRDDLLQRYSRLHRDVGDDDARRDLRATQRVFRRDVRDHLRSTAATSTSSSATASWRSSRRRTKRRTTPKNAVHLRRQAAGKDSRTQRQVDGRGQARVHRRHGR